MRPSYDKRAELSTLKWLFLDKKKPGFKPLADSMLWRDPNEVAALSAPG